MAAEARPHDHLRKEGRKAIQRLMQGARVLGEPCLTIAKVEKEKQAGFGDQDCGAFYLCRQQAGDTIETLALLDK